MAFTYDISNDIGKVRLYCGDTDIVPTTDAIYTDEELQVFLTETGSVFSAAALALIAIASVEARLEKVLKSLNYSIDTKGLSKALREQAAELRAMDGSGNYGVAERALSDFNLVEIIRNKSLRST